MSLFICSKCNTIENTNLVYDYKLGDIEGYPNKRLMDMQNEEIGIEMLCSECNQGHWHGQFPRRQASKLEKDVAALSLYNMVTPYDHPEHSILNLCEETYMVDEKWKYFKELNLLDSILFKIWTEDKMNFNISVLEDYKPDMSDDELQKLVLDCQIYPDESNSDTYKKLTMGFKYGRGTKDKLFMATVAGAMASMGIDFDRVISKHLPKEKPPQDPREKELFLKQAELRREFKKLKRKGKRNLTDEESIEFDRLQQELARIKVEINIQTGTGLR